MDPCDFLFRNCSKIFTFFMAKKTNIELCSKPFYTVIFGCCVSLRSTGNPESSWTIATSGNCHGPQTRSILPAKDKINPSVAPYGVWYPARKIYTRVCIVLKFLNQVFICNKTGINLKDYKINYWKVIANRIYL